VDVLWTVTSPFFIETF